MEKLKLHTPELVADNIEKLAGLFPSCITEARDEQGQLTRSLDFDQLRQELSDHIVEGPRERYHLDWPGKREATQAANAPIAKTLRPCREQSVDFDSTKNLFIEGDNLDALKLLQETYLGKVKLIYIDPPYNTGNDFIYDDDFAEDDQVYLARTSQLDALGGKLVMNPETNGRFHSDWLSMLYPRLRLARTLLRDDGVLFVSIDSREVASVRRLLDEVFGEENFIADFVWEKMYTTKNDTSLVSTCHEYVICYGRFVASDSIGTLPRSAEMDARYSNLDGDPRGVWKPIPMYADGERKNGRFVIVGPSGRKHEPEPNSHWRYTEAEVLRLIADNRVWFGRSGDSQPNLKRFLSELREGVKAKSLWLHKDVGSNDTASRELRDLFSPERSPFSFPKPTTLMKRILTLGASDPESIVLDFFAGSGSTAHAVMELNAQDGGNRRSVLVQIPESCDESSDAFQSGFKTISDIAMERIRRVGRKIKLDVGLVSSSLDIGFRVLKIDTSNMKDVYYIPDESKQRDLLAQVDNIKADRTSEDLLFQVLVDWGVDLSLPIAQETVGGKTIHFVDGNALAACFDQNINDDLVKEIAKRKPLRAVFRDSSYGSDSVKINVEQIFKLLSPATEIRSI